MQLKNRQNGNIYWIRTETDNYEGFMIHASGARGVDDTFCMHYRSLADFLEEWEDPDD